MIANICAISSLIESTSVYTCPDVREKSPTMGSLSVPWPRFPWMRRMCSRLFFRWPPMYVSSISTTPGKCAGISRAIHERRWNTMRSTRQCGRSVSPTMRAIVRSRRKTWMHFVHSPLVLRMCGTGYIALLHSLRHFLHFRLFLRILHERRNPQCGHAGANILVAKLGIAPLWPICESAQCYFRKCWWQC